MSLKHSITLALAVLGTTVWMRAQTPPAPEMTLPQAVAIALAQNPAAAMAQADVRAAAARLSAARAAQWPQLQFSENFSRGNDPVYAFGTRLRQQRFGAADFALSALNQPAPIDNFATRLGGSWQLFNWGGTRAQISAADHGQQSAEAMGQQARQDIILRVVEAYQAVLYAQRLDQLAAQETTTAEALLRQAQARVDAGLAVDSDALSAQVNLAERRQQAIASEGELATAWAGLAAALGVDPAPRHRLAPLTPRTYPEGTLDDLVAAAWKARPDIEALRQQQAASAAAVTAARAGLGPRVSAYGAWETDRPAFTGAGGQNWVAGVELQFDLLPLGQRAQIAQQRAAQDRAEAQARASQAQIRLAVERAYTALHTAQLVVVTAEASRRHADESLRILKNRYAAGLTTMTAVLGAEDATRRSQNDYWRAVYGNTVAYAELLYATGQLTPAAAGHLQ